MRTVSELTMYGRSLLEAERTLSAHKDVVVPVKEVWLEVSRLGQLQRFEVPPLLHFSALLEADERFEFIPVGEELGDDYVEPAYDEDEEYPAEMERLGLYSEDRVRLRNAEVSEELAEEASEEPDEPALRNTTDDEPHPPNAVRKAGKAVKAVAEKKKKKKVTLRHSKVKANKRKGKAT